MPPKAKIHERDLNLSDDEGSSESISATDSGEEIGEEEDIISLQGGQVKELKKKTKRKDEKAMRGKKEKTEQVKGDYRGQLKTNRKKGNDSDVDDEIGMEERVDEHNRDTFFKAYFDETIERVKEDPGGPLVVNDVDFSNMDIGPHELKSFATAILEHFKITGKPCFIHYINFSACRLCGFDYKVKPPPAFGDQDDSSGSKVSPAVLSQKSDLPTATRWDHSGFRKFMKLLKYARYSLIQTFLCIIIYFSHFHLHLSYVLTY